MNEYALTLKISWWSLFWKHSETDVYTVHAATATEALAIARSGMIPELQKYDDSFEEENAVDLSHLTIQVQSISRV